MSRTVDSDKPQDLRGLQTLIPEDADGAKLARHVAERLTQFAGGA